MSQLFSLVLAVAGCLLFVAGAGGQEPYRKLGAGEIARAVPGMEFTDEVHWAYVFERGGRLNSVAMGKPMTGSWRQQKDRLCLTRPAEQERCYEVWRAEKNVQLREPGFDIHEEGVLQTSAKRS
ncbi:hypothetical protein [Alsobacter sp. SYSU BS001988]